MKNNMRWKKNIHEREIQCPGFQGNVVGAKRSLALLGELKWKTWVENEFHILQTFISKNGRKPTLLNLSIPKTFIFPKFDLHFSLEIISTKPNIPQEFFLGWLGTY